MDSLELVNKLIREEHGTKVTLDNTLEDSTLDSLGVLSLIIGLEEAYGDIDIEGIENTTTIKEIIEKLDSLD